MSEFVNAAEALREAKTEMIEQHLLGFVGWGHATRADSPVAAVRHSGGQNQVAALDLGELLDQRPRAGGTVILTGAVAVRRNPTLGGITPGVSHYPVLEPMGI